MDDIDREVQKYLKELEKKCKDILEECIIEYVYMAYEPTTYNRTESLLNSVRTKIENNSLYVYIDTDAMSYWSAVDGRNVTEAVPYWVNFGHHRDIENPTPEYDDYDGRHYIEKAAKRIEKELGIKCNIINDKPPIV